MRLVLILMRGLVWDKEEEELDAGKVGVVFGWVVC